jgi:hypothetical protein
MEFTRDYDRHNCGYVTRTQFAAGLVLAGVHLHPSELAVITSTYMHPDPLSTLAGKVAYRRFDAEVSEIFSVSNLEANPLANVNVPNRDFLMKPVSNVPLSDKDADQLANMLSRFRVRIAERRPLIASYFADFDRNLGIGYQGKVTRSQFARLLSGLGMEVSESDFLILCQRYNDNDRVRYWKFIHDVDPTGLLSFYLMSISFPRVERISICRTS